MGFEPTTFSLEAPKTGVFDKKNVDWVAFQKYLKTQNYRHNYDRQISSVAMRYSDIYFSKNFSPIKQFSLSAQSKIIAAFSALAKFQGCHEEFQYLRKTYGLTWVSRSVDDLIIERLSRSDDSEDIFQWIRTVKEACPQYAIFMDLIASTGLRLSEAINAYNLIVQLSKEETLAKKYYNAQTGFLEHFRFRNVFIRNTKKAFLSFVPLELLDLIGKQSLISENHLKNRALERKHIQQRFGDVRENHASFVTKWLRPEEIDFLQGRVSASVFSAHYYNPILVSDLKLRAAQATQAILLKVNSELLLKKEQGGDLNGEI